MTNDERNPKIECRKAFGCAVAGFVVGIWVFVHMSSFVIRIWRLRFMQTLLPLLRMHRDHEPRNRSAGRKAPINRTHSKRFAPAESADCATAFGVRASSAPLSKACCDSVDGRFMESPLSLLRTHWDHEPEIRKSFEIKPSVSGSWRAFFRFRACIGTLNPSRSPSPVLRTPSPPLGERAGVRGSDSWKAFSVWCRALEP